jgi:septum formation protein
MTMAETAGAIRIVLASASPRRAKILKGLGLEFEVSATDAEEVAFADDPERTVSENALAKGRAYFESCGCDPAAVKVVSADTIVWHRGRIYGKPRDLEEAKEFLRELSGETHQVFTAVALNGREVKVVVSDVRFRRLDESLIAEYVERVKPTDRAGAYDIDESGELVVEGWTGSYENIMGLPVGPLEEWGIARAGGQTERGMG